MVERVIHLEDKKKCGLTFKITLDVPFSISLKEKDAEDFKQIVANRGDDVSKVLRDFLFELAGIADKRKNDIFLAEPTDLAREKYYKKLKVSRTNSFSEILEKKILEHNKLNKPTS